MVMECLEAGGMGVAKSKIRDGYNTTHSAGYYSPNHAGLYDLPVIEMRGVGFPREHDGKAVKVVVPFLRMLSVHEYEVIFMRRDTEEIRQSLEAAFKIKQTTAIIEKQIEEGLKILHNRKDVCRLVEWDYRDILIRPRWYFESLGWPIDTQKAASVVNPDLCRFRLERLGVGL